MSEIDWDTPESAGRYDQNCDHQFRKGRMLVVMMGIKDGDFVLDIGCGTGQQAVHVAGIIGPYGRLTGIDPSSHRIEIARKKFTGDPVGYVRFQVGQAEDLSAVPDHSIDHAYLCSSFHWIDDKRNALGEIYRVLKPRGMVGMTTRADSPDMRKKLTESIFQKYHVKRSGVRYGGIKRVTAPELFDLLSGAGFTGITIEPREIRRQYGSPEEFLKHYREQGRHAGLLKDVPDDVREKIMKEIAEEHAKQQTRADIGFGNVTLFAIAQKSDTEI